MRRVGTVLAVLALTAADVYAEPAVEKQWQDPTRSARENQWQGSDAGSDDWRQRPVRTLFKYLHQTVTGTDEEAVGDEPQATPEPAAAPKQTQRRRARVAKAAPEPRRAKRSRDEEQWWETVGNPAVFAFSNCVAGHAEAETRRDSRASYPEMVTQAMNGPCKSEFDAMAHLMLARHGEDGFRKIAKELIGTTFLPAVREAVQRVQAGAEQTEADKARLENEMRAAKEAMLGCFVGEADRLAAISGVAADRLADAVIASCRPKADLFFTKLDELYPDAAGPADKASAIIASSYRPAIVTRINSLRAAGPSQ